MGASLLAETLQPAGRSRWLAQETQQGLPQGNAQMAATTMQTGHQSEHMKTLRLNTLTRHHGVDLCYSLQLSSRIL